LIDLTHYDIDISKARVLKGRQA